MVHDWSTLNYASHDNKTDKKPLHHSAQGYELQSSVVLSDETGLPLGVLAQNVTSSTGVWSSYQGDGLQPEAEHLQELATRVQWLEQQAIAKPLVHIVDREGDGVEWLRACSSSQWLIRSRKTSRVNFQGKSLTVHALAEQLDYPETYRKVNYKGKTAYQTVAQCAVDVVRSAHPKRQKSLIHDTPLSAKRVVSRIIDAEKNSLAQWYLLSNVLTEPAETLQRGITGDGRLNASSNCSNNKVYSLKAGNKKPALPLPNDYSLPPKPVSSSGKSKRKTHHKPMK